MMNRLRAALAAFGICAFSAIEHHHGPTVVLPSGGSLMGVLPEIRILTTAVHLEPGDRLLFYTDGATEARNGRRFLGTEGLIDILDRGPGGAREAGEWIESAVLDWSGGRLQDDMALLVVQARQ